MRRGKALLKRTFRDVTERVGGGPENGHRLRRRLRRAPSVASRAVIWTVVINTAAQALIVTVLMVDAMRKRRDPPPGGFPRLAPLETTVSDSRITTYMFGKDVYVDMLDAIRNARDYVLFETFIWKGDHIGEEFKRCLIAAADRGVKVYVIYDVFANLVVPRRFKRFPKHMHVMPFGIIRGTPTMRKTGRDHRKILVVDGEVGFVGGYNIGNLYATQWRDTHLRVEGPGTWELTSTFMELWNLHCGRRLPRLELEGSHDWDASISSARNTPRRMLFPIRGMYIDAISRAQQRIRITQAYFIPDTDILQAMLTAARRGVRVDLIIPEISNHVVADWVARGYYTELLAGGVRIWLYQHAMVHAKTATIDTRWTTVGTANIDRLSLMGNYEVNLEILDATHAGQMEEVFSTDLRNCRELTLEEWQARPLVSRISERILAPLHPLL